MAKGKKKNLLPKKIAGVKVPKKARRGRFGELLASRQGQMLLAEALLSAGAFAATLKAKDNPKVRRAVKKTGDKATDAGRDAAHGAAAAGSTFAYALGEAARSFAEALRHGETRSFARPADDQTTWTPDYGAPESQAPKSPSKAPRPPLASEKAAN